MASSLLDVGLQGLANYCTAGAKICKSSPPQRHFYADLRRFAQILGIFYANYMHFYTFLTEAESTFVLIHKRFLHVCARGFLIAIDILPQDFLMLIVAK